MKCTQVRSFLSPYLDSELEGTTTFEISRHLEICAPCARLFAREAELDRAIFARIQRPEGDERAVLERALDRALSSRGSARRARSWSAAAVLLVLAAWALWKTTADRETPALVELVAGDHRHYVRGEAVLDCDSTTAREIAAFLDASLDQPACDLPAGEPWEIQGARICRYEGQRFGMVILRYRGAPITVGDLPAGATPLPDDAVAAAETGRCFELPGGRGMVGRTACGLRIAFGDVEVERLAEIIAAAGPAAGHLEGAYK